MSTGLTLKRIGKATAAALKLLLPPMVNKDELADAVGYIENAGTPVGSLVPDFVGQKCFDTTNKVWYVAFDTATNNDWSPVSLDELSLAELQVLDGVVAGTVSASKAVVVDANKDVGDFRNHRATRHINQEGAFTSVNTAGAATITAAQILTGVYVRDCNGAGRTDTLDTAAAIVAALPGAKVGDTLRLNVINGSDAAETLTLAAGAGGTFDANQTAAARVVPQNSSKVLVIRLTNVTPASEAYACAA